MPTISSDRRVFPGYERVQGRMKKQANDAVNADTTFVALFVLQKGESNEIKRYMVIVTAPATGRRAGCLVFASKAPKYNARPSATREQRECCSSYRCTAVARTR